MIEFDLKIKIPEESHDFCRLLADKYGISEVGTLGIIEKVLETAFGNGRPGSEDLIELKELTLSVRKIILQRKGVFQKFLFVFWKGF